nr:MBL fold metallo-hydrolase [uncultured Pseudodesulfovibrio sp.]
MKKTSILSISDGYYEYTHPRQLLFPGVAEAALMAAGISAGKWNSWISPYTPTIIQSEETTILVDAGAGDLASTTGQLVDNIKLKNMHPNDIDCIILTHLHPDHIAGLLTSNGQNPFTNARIILSDIENSYWRTKPDLLELNIPPEVRTILQSTASEFLQRYSDRIETVSMDEQLTPNISLFAAPGHTPGHVGVEVQTHDTLFLIAGDAFLHPTHLTHPEWSSSVDIMPKTATRTRRHILERMEKGSSKLLGFHF